MIKLSNPLRGAILKKWPDGSIFQLYGENPQLYGGKGHPGLDIALTRGTDVLAAHGGVVQSVVPESPTNKYGHFVTILSDKNFAGEQVLTQYAHLLDWSVYEGQRVQEGEVIGHEGNSGYVISGGSVFWGNAPANLGNHLHFNVFYYINGIQQSGLNGMNTVDPLPFLLGQAPDSMRYVINPKGDQYVIFDNPKVAIGIADVEELSQLRTVGLSGDPVSGEVPEGYLVYPGIRTSRLIDLFNI